MNDFYGQKYTYYNAIYIFFYFLIYWSQYVYIPACTALVTASQVVCNCLDDS